MKKCAYILFILISIASSSYCQHIQGLYEINRRYEDDPYDELTYSYAGLNLLSNNIYMGRKDSLALPYITPYVGYQLHNGLYAKAGLSFAPNGRDGRVDLLALEGGYDRTFGYHILTGIWLEYDKFQKNSPSILAAYTNKAGFYCIYRNATFEPQLTLISSSGRASDIAAGLGVAHNFRFFNNTLNVFPTITLFAGSDNFYSAYLQRKQDQNTHIMWLSGPAVPDAGNFKPLGIEVSAKAIWRVNEWLFTFKPTLSIPLSPEKIYYINGTHTEATTNSIFAELDICYRHERK